MILRPAVVVWIVLKTDTTFAFKKLCGESSDINQEVCLEGKKYGLI